MGFMHRIKQLKDIVNDAEQVYDTLKDRGEPAAFDVLFPLLYKYALQRNSHVKIADPRIIAFAGQYLSTRFPHLQSYFVDQQHREHILEMKRVLDEYFAVEEKQ
jgi:hypothetical protein